MHTEQSLKNKRDKMIVLKFEETSMCNTYTSNSIRAT